jgi:hypothetical protein
MLYKVHPQNLAKSSDCSRFAVGESVLIKHGLVARRIKKSCKTHSESALGVRRDKTSMIAKRSPLVMKTSAIFLCLSGLEKSLRFREKTVHSGFVAEDKDVAGMAGTTPRIKLFLAGAGESPDWSEKPVEQLMLDALALR